MQELAQIDSLIFDELEKIQKKRDGIFEEIDKLEEEGFADFLPMFNQDEI